MEKNSFYNNMPEASTLSKEGKADSAMWDCLILWPYQKDEFITASFSFPGHWHQGETMHSQNSGSIHPDSADDREPPSFSGSVPGQTAAFGPDTYTHRR